MGFIESVSNCTGCPLSNVTHNDPERYLYRVLSDLFNEKLKGIIKQ